MTTVLDTNLLSELRLPNPDPNVSAWFAAQPQADLAIASFSVAEIEYGIARIPQSGSLATQLVGWLNAIVATQRILPLDADSRAHFRPPDRGARSAQPHHLTAAGTQAAFRRRSGDCRNGCGARGKRRDAATSADFRLIAQHCPGLTGIDPWTGQTF